jgi:hypothetical protein
MARLTNEVNGVSGRVTAQGERMNRQEANVARAWNTAVGDGLTIPWMTVLFADGTDPATTALPPIRNRNDLGRLRGRVLTEYLRRYGVPDEQHRTLNEKLQLLGPKIGYFYFGEHFSTGLWTSSSV